MKPPEDNEKDPEPFLMTTPRGNLILCDGRRRIEIWDEHHRSGELVEITLHAVSLRRWEYPHQNEPITDEVRQGILQKVKRLLEAKDPCIGVKIKW